MQITDVAGGQVGPVYKNRGELNSDGITAVIPIQGNLFSQKCQALSSWEIGFGKLAWSTQVQEPDLKGPIIVDQHASAVAAGKSKGNSLRYSLGSAGMTHPISIALVGETNDGYLKDIRGMHLSRGK